MRDESVRHSSVTDRSRRFGRRATTEQRQARCRRESSRSADQYRQIIRPNFRKTKTAPEWAPFLNRFRSAQLPRNGLTEARRGLVGESPWFGASTTTTVPCFTRL